MNDAPIRYNKALVIARVLPNDRHFRSKNTTCRRCKATENHHNQGSPSACCILLTLLEVSTASVRCAPWKIRHHASCISGDSHPTTKNMRKVELTHWLKDVFKVFTAKSMGNPGGRAIKGGLENAIPVSNWLCSLQNQRLHMCDRDVKK